MAEYFCKEDLVEHLEYLNNELPLITEHDWGRAKGYDEVIDEIKKYPSADVQPVKWIPVTERLPECDLGAEVGNIEWISCGMVHAGCFGRGGKYRDAYFRTWTDAGEGMDAKDADYWRAVTLPEPPKDGGKNG